MPGPTPHYPAEFEQEAIKLYRSSEKKSIPKIAEERRIASESLRRWIRQRKATRRRAARRVHHRRA